MGKLDANMLALRVCKVDDALERLNLRVLPKAAVFGRDAAFGCYCCCFDEGKAWTARNDAPEVSLWIVSAWTVMSDKARHTICQGVWWP